MPRRSHKYDEAYAAVRRVVNEHDPEGLLEMGAPEDEYDPEVTDLVRLVLRGDSLDPRDVIATWARWFGEGVGFRREPLKRVATELQEVHQRFRAHPVPPTDT